MVASLNTGSTFIKYDLRMDTFFDGLGIGSEIIFNFNLPFLLPKLNECYYIQIPKNTFSSKILSDSKRYVVFSGTRNWIEKQKISSRYSTISIGGQGNTVLNTSLSIAVEIKNDEKNFLSKFIDNKEFIYEMRSILQDAIEVISYKYNLNSDGESFFEPSYLNCDRMHCYFMKNYVEKRRIIWEYISPNKNSPTNDSYNETPILQEEMGETIDNWRYFKNKSNYQFRTCNYLDSIISAAIAIETFAYSVVSSFCDSEDKINDYSSEIVEKDGEKQQVFLSMGRLIKKLKNENKIITTLSNNKIEKCIYKILKPRNDIMHGKCIFNISYKIKAKEVNEALNNFFSSITIDSNKKNEVKKIKEQYEYRKFLYYPFQENITYQELFDEAQKFVDKYPDYEYPRLIYFKSAFLLDEKEIASNEQKYLLKHSKNVNAIVIDIADFYLNNKKFEEAMEILNNFENLGDERVYTMLGLMYFIKFEKTKNSFDLNKAHDFCIKAHNINKKYLTNYMLLRTFYYFDNHFEEALNCSIIMAKSDHNDYESYLFCAECSIILNKVEDTFNYIKQFLEHIEKNDYKVYKLDFLLIEVSENLYERAKKICDILIKSDLKKEEVTIISERLEKVIRDKKFNGVYSASGPGMVDKSEEWPEHLIKTDFPDSISLSILGDTADEIILKNVF